MKKKLIQAATDGLYGHRKKVDETIALYEDNFKKIKDGMKLSKSSDDAVELQWHILGKYRICEAGS